MGTTTSTEPRVATSSQMDGKSLSLWLWVAGAFLVLGLVWAVLFTVAHSARVETVPLAPKGARP